MVDFCRCVIFCDLWKIPNNFPSGKDPVPIDFKMEALPGNKVADLPVAVIASNRPLYLYRMLRSLLSMPGADASMITVYIDGFFEEPAAVCKLFKVKSVHHTPVCSKNCRIGQVSVALSLFIFYHIHPYLQIQYKLVHSLHFQTLWVSDIK